ncbi:MAG: septum formation initiator family protein [Bdellovibrionota bacterium]
MFGKRLQKQKKSVSLFVTASGIYLMLLVVFSVLGDRGLMTSYHLWKEKQRLENLIAVLEQENQVLKADIHRFRQDDVTLEHYARKNLKLKGENEIQYIWP